MRTNFIVTLCLFLTGCLASVEGGGSAGHIQINKWEKIYVDGPIDNFDYVDQMRRRLSDEGFSVTSERIDAQYIANMSYYADFDLFHFKFRRFNLELKSYSSGKTVYEIRSGDSNLESGDTVIKLAAKKLGTILARDTHLTTAITSNPVQNYPVSQAPRVGPTDANKTSYIPNVSAFGRYFALVIGNAEYADLPNLKTSRNDSRAMAHLLKHSYGFDVTLIENASRDDIVSALDNARSYLDDNDNFLVFYAGHGWLDQEADRGYWLPIDATGTNRTRWLSSATITDTLKAMKAKRVILIADSCYSGELTRSIDRGVSITPRNSGYWENLQIRRSRTVLTSGGLEPVIDGGGGAHSVFAAALIHALTENTNIVDGTQIFSKVREQVRLNSDQTPQYANIRLAGHEIGGDFVFIKAK